MTPALFDDAVALHRLRRFSYWDSAIIAAARAQGCELI
jgi:predicted nucleic acid-binding protein